MIAHTVRRGFACGLLSIFLSLFAFGQQSGQTGTGGSSNSGNSSAGNKTVRPSVRNSSSAPAIAEMPRILFFSGRVVQADGLPVPLGAVVEGNCGGSSRTVASVNPDGGFSFQLGQSTDAFSSVPQASDNSAFSGMPGQLGRMRDPLWSAADASPHFESNNCEFRANLSGYRSSTVVLRGPFDSGQRDVGTILLLPASRVAGTVVSMSDLRAPKQAKKALERAQKAIQKKNYEQAKKDLDAAVALYPGYATAWAALGRVCQQMRRNEEAHKAFAASIAADPNYINPYLGLAQVSGAERKWQEVADVTDHAIELDPLDYPEAYYYNAIAYYSLDKPEAAERSALKLAGLDGLHRYPVIHLLLADIFEEKKDARGAIEQLEKYLQFLPGAANSEQVRMRLESLRKSSGLSAGINSTIQQKSR